MSAGGAAQAGLQRLGTAPPFPGWIFLPPRPVRRILLHMSAAAYVLARFSHADKLIPAIAALKTCPQVQRWDAVEGRHFQLVLKISPPAVPLPNELRQIDGVRELTTFEILADVDHGAQLAPQVCHAYLFIECEPGKLASVTAVLDGLEQVATCSQVRGGCDLVVIVRGDSFQAIDRLVNDKIQHLDGILRLKKNRVIDLKQL